MTKGIPYCDAVSKPSDNAMFMKVKEVLSQGCWQTAGACPISDNTGLRRGSTGGEGPAGSKVGGCWVPPSLFSLPSTPTKEEAERQGEGHTSMAPREAEVLRRGVG
jgi:hypothetical protein